MLTVESHLHCPMCGYDLFGSHVDARCSECGAAVSEAMEDGLATLTPTTRRAMRWGARALLLDSCLNAMFVALFLAAKPPWYLIGVWYSFTMLAVPLAAAAARVVAPQLLFRSRFTKRGDGSCAARSSLR